MPVSGDKLREFIAFAQGLKGDEKGEANLYVDRLMRAFGHEGSIEAGGTHELRIRIQEFAAAAKGPKPAIEANGMYAVMVLRQTE